MTQEMTPAKAAEQRIQDSAVYDLLIDGDRREWDRLHGIERVAVPVPENWVAAACQLFVKGEGGMKYTAEDFDYTKRMPSDDAILAALRIAAAVMRPGVLGEVVMKQLGPNAKPEWVEETVNAIRKALTDG